MEYTTEVYNDGQVFKCRTVHYSVGEFPDGVRVRVPMTDANQSYDLSIILLTVFFLLFILSRSQQRTQHSSKNCWVISVALDMEEGRFA